MVPIALKLAQSFIPSVDMEKFTEWALRIDLETSAQGYIVQSYMKYRIMKYQQFKIKTRKVKFTKSNKIDMSNANVVEINVKDLLIENFSGNSLPQNFRHHRNTAYIPCSPNYPEIDFFVWEHEKNKLWAIQITVGKNPGIHVDQWISSQACKDWLKALKTETIQPTTQKIWIIATDPSKLWDGHVFCNIIGEDFKDSLKKSFPALLHFIGTM